MHMLRNGGRKNLSEWVKHIVDNFCEEQAIDERALFNNIKDRFHNDFHESFLCTIPTLLFKILIDKGVAHISATNTYARRTKIQQRQKANRSVEAIHRRTTVEKFRQLMNPIVNRK